MRTTKEMIYGKFRELCEAASKVCVDQVAEADRPHIGAWGLDYDPIGKGYYIYVVLEGSKRSHPFGIERRPGGELFRAMRFCISVLQSVRIDRLVQRQHDKIREALSALKPDIEDVDEWMGRRR